MKRFAELYAALDRTTKTNEKLRSLEQYFRTAPDEDAAWALYFLSGNTVPRPVSSTTLRLWVAEAAQIDAWLLEESYHIVGDLAETFALLLKPHPVGTDVSLRILVENCLMRLPSLPEEERKHELLTVWQSLTQKESFLFMKLVTGGMRVGIQRTLLSRALAAVSKIPQHQIAHRLMGGITPSPEYLRRILSKHTGEVDPIQPYPLCLAYPLEGSPEALGPREDWQVEWKWDGIRAEIIKRAGNLLIWSRGEEVITDGFPEIADACSSLPDGSVLDGEIVAWKNELPLPFGELQKRLGRKKLSKKLLEEIPAHFLAYDLLELEGEDIRERPTSARRSALEQVVSSLAASAVTLSPVVGAATWELLTSERLRSREVQAEGLMLKKKDAPYGVGRRRGLWWKWKIDPFTCDAVLVYAQRGHGRRAGLYTDYTFAIWKDGELVPVAKAYSGLTDEEFLLVNRFIRENTIERFGPVVTVTPQLVFELAFDDIRVSKRHKAGLALRFPRIARMRPDKTPQDADTVEVLRTLLPIP